ncbi:MAG: hypothetical protein WBI17_01975, partial [Clostridiaceae bacterium]
MKKFNKTLFSSLILSVILLVLLIYSKNFEGILNQLFSAKFPSGSRTPLHVLFLEHLEMVLISSLIAIIAGFLLGVFVTTKYGSVFKDSLLKLVNLGQAFPSAA